jgi:hypothetical protein
MVIPFAYFSLVAAFTTVAEMFSCHKDCVAWKPKEFTTCLFRQKFYLPHPVLDCWITQESYLVGLNNTLVFTLAKTSNWILCLFPTIIDPCLNTTVLGDCLIWWSEGQEFVSFRMVSYVYGSAALHFRTHLQANVSLRHSDLISGPNWPLKGINITQFQPKILNVIRKKCPKAQGNDCSDDGPEQTQCLPVTGSHDGGWGHHCLYTPSCNLLIIAHFSHWTICFQVHTSVN